MSHQLFYKVFVLIRVFFIEICFQDKNSNYWALDPYQFISAKFEQRKQYPKPQIVK